MKFNWIKNSLFLEYKVIPFLFMASFAFLLLVLIAFAIDTLFKIIGGC